MLSYLGNAAEVAYWQECKQIPHTCTIFCPIALSMNYIANALASRPTSARSMLSFTSTQASSILEESTPEELSDGEFPFINTRASSVTTAVKKTSAPSDKSRPKTVFCLAHPPPVSIHKQHLHIRPRVLLQLQSITDTARPNPVLEVLPSFVFASRLARRFPRTFKGKAGLGADDLVIVSSENYKLDGAEAGQSDGIFEAEKWDERELVAAICQVAKDEVGSQGTTQICLNDGSLWTASRLASGAYEFVTVDAHGLRTVARWVPKQPRSLQRASNIRRERSTSEEKRFNFSLLNPSSRRHAIIASMDRHSIDISAQYTEPPVCPRSPAPSTPTSSSFSTSEEFPLSVPVEVSQSLRTLITVTGICVAFQEGFSVHFRHTDNAPSSPNLGTKQRHRSLTLGSNGNGAEQPLSPARSSFAHGQRARGNLQQTSSSSAVPLSPRSIQADTPLRRTMSTGGAFLQRIKRRNISGTHANQLSPVGDYEGSDAEKTPNRMDSRSTSGVSSLYSSAASSTVEEGSPLSTVPSSGLDVAQETSALTLGVTKRPRRLSRLFGLPRKASGARS